MAVLIPAIYPSTSLEYDGDLEALIRMEELYVFGDRLYYTIDGTAIELANLEGLSFVRSQRVVIPISDQTSDITIRAAVLRGTELSPVNSITYTYVNTTPPLLFDPRFDNGSVNDLGDIVGGVAGTFEEYVLNKRSSTSFRIKPGTSLPSGFALHAIGYMHGTADNVVADETTQWTIQASNDDFSTVIEKNYQVRTIVNTQSSPAVVSSESLDKRIELKATILKTKHGGLVDMLITWTKFGIADIQGVSLHEVTIDFSHGLFPPFPYRYVLDEAKDSRYALIHKNWNTARTYTVTLKINNNYEKVLTVYSRTSYIDHLGFYQYLNSQILPVKAINQIDGIVLDFSSETYDLLAIAKNIKIYRGVSDLPTQEVLPLVYSRSADLQFTLPTDKSDYAYITQDGVPVQDYTQDSLDELISDRAEVVIQVSYLDGTSNSLANHIEEVDVNTIRFWDPDKILNVVTFEVLGTDLHNSFDLLYYTEDTEEYFRYRPSTLTLPFQPFTLNPDLALQGFDIKLLDTNLDNTLNITVPGVLVGTSNVQLKVSVRDSESNYTSFSSGIDFSNLEAQIPTGTGFFNGYYKHLDLDTNLNTGVVGLEDNTLYTYQVDVEDWFNKTHTLYRGVIRRNRKDHFILDTTNNISNLETPLEGDAKLSEYDFQSGISHNTKVFIETRKNA